MSEEFKKRVSRRKFVTLTGGAITASAILAACGDNTAAPTTAATTAAATTAATTTSAAATTAAAATSAAATSAAATTAAATSAAATTAAATSAAATTAAGTSAAATSAAATTAAASGQAFQTDYAAVGQELADAMAGKLKGKTVTLIHGITAADEVTKFTKCFDDFQAKTGITVKLNAGGNDALTVIATKVSAGTIDDIVNFPQPGSLALYTQQGKVKDLTKIINQDWMKKVYNQGFIDTATLADQSGTKILAGVFQRINFKSAVWYPKKAFDAAGYKVPTTWAEQQALMDQIVKDGDTPWAFGIESGGATGWPATDWLEDIMLRTTSLENYDKWTTGALPFTDPVVKKAMQVMTDIFFNDKYVYGGRKTIVTTNFGNAGTPMFSNPPKAWLLKQGNFITTFFEQNTPGLKAGVDYDFYYLPPIDAQYGKPVLFAGDLFGLFNDKPESRAVIQFLTTYESIQPWIKAGGGGAISPHKNANLADYTTELDRKTAQFILQATSARFDGSDLMPAAVGSGSEWKGMTDYFSGTANLDQALTTMQAGWNNVKK